MGKKTNSQTRKYAGKSFKSTKPNPSETPNNIPNLKSSSRYKSERNFQSLTKSSSNLLLKSSLKKSKSVDSVHKNKLVSKTYNKEHQSTNEMENLVDLVKGLEIQEEQSVKQPTSTPLIEISPKSEIESESPLSDGGISPRLQRKGSFDLNLKKSPLLSFSSSDLEDNEDFSGVSDFKLDEQVGLMIDSPAPTSPVLVSDDELMERDKELIVQNLMSMVFYRGYVYSITGYCEMPMNIRNDLHHILLSTIFKEEHTRDEMDYEGNDYLECFITQNVIYQLLYDMRYENPYGMSARFVFLENIAHIDRSLYYLILKSLYIYTQDYIEIEKTTPYVSPEEAPPSSIVQVTGHIHRYISLFDSLVKMFREFLSLDETTSYQTQYMYFSQILYLHISLLTIFLKSRYSICKYTNLLASLTSILISMNNSVIPQLFRTIIKVWPIGLAEKQLSFLDYFEQLLSSLPPLYTLMEYKSSIFSMFKLICHCLQEYQAKVAARAISLLTNYYICNNIIYVDNDICELVKNTFSQGCHYWNPIVAENCENAFDALLDSL